jgi:hypothetical protein
MIPSRLTRNILTMLISTMAVYVGMVVCALVFVAIPVIYFGQLDGTSAIVLTSGIALLIWTAMRVRSLRK